MDNLEIWRSAHLLLTLHGVDALFVAAQSANALLDKGDTAGSSAWVQIGHAIGELLREEPRAGEALN